MFVVEILLMPLTLTSIICAGAVCRVESQLPHHMLGFLWHVYSAAQAASTMATVPCGGTVSGPSSAIGPHSISDAAMRAFCWAGVG